LKIPHKHTKHLNLIDTQVNKGSDFIPLRAIVRKNKKNKPPTLSFLLLMTSKETSVALGKLRSPWNCVTGEFTRSRGDVYPSPSDSLLVFLMAYSLFFFQLSIQNQTTNQKKKKKKKRATDQTTQDNT